MGQQPALCTYRLLSRDIKPDNILLIVVEGIIMAVKVTDFSVARNFSKSDEQTKTDVGTDPYKPIEVTEGHYTESIDVKTLGLVAYLLKTGELIGKY